ncbi:MAG: 50S ribosomal protein L4 [Candidatus Phytoplasma stylosanthis]|uniref:50S ribosomal protein L4 n=1 Tax=Candidatus Phytoplasma stylosanthis TaxID=2798314 RepID=UPI00293B5392|nr:50S ribosomal protein L4 [Candidatus Phytoplasma stylosanthis]MDV3167839.1 50S ribosomal protein L4 [Candidatus Phytoplasma stylosanthis]MDV3170885.1 50S ribosomal protein L4 [Candidatus Phytoplasma stylosanthis]MDV3174065.1 50S ribosomal protein L4 [Candidatus Phytoplasma stylosanthis]MDV3202423.1 50S ribosomal protein L4 [Candidatus Phytoplasma stylosanthis]
MTKCNVFNQKGEFVTELFLSQNIFGIKPNKQVLYDVVNQQRAAMRQGTHCTKNRAAVSGGGRKPWAQKGTGNARHGSIRSPLWKGGGVAFGPKPRKYNFKVNAKIRKLAMISSLSWQKENDNIIVVDSLKLESHKTNYFSSFLNKLKIKDKVLVIVDELNENLIYSTRNLPQVTLESVSHVSVYQILNAKNLLVNQEVIKYFEEVLK